MKKHTKSTGDETAAPAADITEDVEEEDKPFLNRDNDATQSEDDMSEEDTRKMAATQNKIMQKFFPAYFVAILADWLHGPYLYNVYEEKGYSHSQSTYYTMKSNQAELLARRYTLILTVQLGCYSPLDLPALGFLVSLLGS